MRVIVLIKKYKGYTPGSTLTFRDKVAKKLVEDKIGRYPRPHEKALEKNVIKESKK
tara:strand:- start:5830 stop:5997 length:168 start_codon:yes stop_codon:yes gene_type:complete